MLCIVKLILFDLLIRMYEKFGRNNVIYNVVVNLFYMSAYLYIKNGYFFLVSGAFMVHLKFYLTLSRVILRC